MDDKIGRVRKTNETSDVLSIESSALELIMQQVLPSEQQSVEWKIRAFKAPFGLLRLPMTPDSESRRIIQFLFTHHLNLRT